MTTAATVAAGPVGAPWPLPDADLLAAAAQFMELHAINVRAHFPDHTYTEEFLDEAHDRWHEKLRLVADLPATTWRGLAAKARVMVAAFEMDVPSFLVDTVESCASPHEWVAWRLAHDLLGGIAVA